MDYDLSILSVSDHVWNRGRDDGFEGRGDMYLNAEYHGPYSCSYIEGYLAGKELAKKKKRKKYE